MVTSLKEARISLAMAPELTIGEVRQVPGYVHGLRASGVLARVEVSGAAHWREIARRSLAMLAARLRLAQRPETIVASARFSPILSCIVRAVTALQEAAGMPLLGEARVIPLPARRRMTDAGQWRLAIPALAPVAVADALPWINGWFHAVAAMPGCETLPPDQRDALERLLASMARLTPRGSNNRFFINAAHELDIPIVPMPGGVIQYGWGRRSRWLDSSFTELTSTISSRLARSKVLTNALLRQAGVPVAAQRLAPSLEVALEAAAVLGYPVVVKPANQDGGVGVSAGLQSEEHVRTAFGRARKYSSEILVEKHVEGRDYRVYVHRGRAIGAMERTPAGVTGDGAQTVEALIATANLDPRRGVEEWAQLTPLVLDEEALELLTASGMNAQSVPARGQFVRLRRSANVSTGGIPVGVFEQMHPDNARLCERAVQVLRLDLAGVDLLIPDIRRSWRQTGAAICEINGQPQISSVACVHLFPQLLREMVPEQGRIPCILVIASRSCSKLVRETADLLAERNVCVGATSPEGLRIGGWVVRQGRGSAFADARALLRDSSVDVLVIGSDGKEWLSAGLPIDRIDVLVVADANNGLHEALAAVRPYCRGEVIASRDDSAMTAATTAMRGRHVRWVDTSTDLPAAGAAAYAGRSIPRGSRAGPQVARTSQQQLERVHDPSSIPWA